MIFTKKSSLISRNTTIDIFATKSIVKKGMKFLKSSQRCRPFKVSRSDFKAISSSVGCGSRFSAYPNKASKGNATAPIKAGIQNSLTCHISITYKPTDFAVPELITILTPNKLARTSVILRPSIKLKIIPHMHPSESPFKNIAAIL